MYATRRLLKSSGAGSGGGGLLSGVPKTILPPPTFSEVASSALKGAWQHVTDQESRDLYERLVQDGVVKDTVLHSAYNGSTLTYALFSNLQNPLFQQHKFDAKEFVHAVKPALDNFHWTIGQLRNQLSDTLLSEQQKQQSEESSSSSLSSTSLAEELQSNLKQTAKQLLSSEAVEKDGTTTYEGKGNVDLTEALLGRNYWKEQAKADPDSLAGILSRMTSEPCFDALYYTSKLDIIGKSSSGGVNLVYEDCAVNEVALLGARARIVDENNGDDDDDDAFDYEEFKASDQASSVNDRDASVGAQMDVLFEVTHTLRPSPSPSPSLDATTAKAIGQQDTVNDNAGDQEKPQQGDEASLGQPKQEKDGDGDETVTVTNLAVAIFEGWFHKRGQQQWKDNEQMRWRLAVIREAFEFPRPA